MIGSAASTGAFFRVIGGTAVVPGNRSAPGRCNRQTGGV
jgi:hypothetical protein